MMAKRLAEQAQEYQEVKSEVIKAAIKHNCSIIDIRLQLDYEDDFEW